MARTDTSKAKIKKTTNGQLGVYAVQNISAGDIVFLEDIVVFESIAAAGEEHIPVQVRLSWRILQEGHFNRLKELGFSTKRWKKTIPNDVKKWIDMPIKNGHLTKNDAYDAFNLAAAYNVVCGYILGEVGDSIHAYQRATISPMMCMMNHSCEPNAKLWSTEDPEEIKQRVAGMVALRDIKAGEEITFSYLVNISDELAEDMSSMEKNSLQPLSKNVNSRRQQIYQKFGFKCECPKCRAESKS
ncbi:MULTISPECIES: SET domain-containing methyltransferase [unclassified Marinobacterium]|uniref:SET domain-containing protein n=1 Tax=unclassified Marinobacterium TaxID=2644139 RepID=UPI00156876C1|nr:SET domain protein [Marinobacterium sp. xm-g-48]NRP83473.1 SET domain protein [Marinobacterium sp. xm-d-509]